MLVHKFIEYLSKPPEFTVGRTALQQRLSILLGACTICIVALPWLTARLSTICMRDSISHFYYDPFVGTLFIGLLFFIGGAMIAFPA